MYTDVNVYKANQIKQLQQETYPAHIDVPNAVNVGERVNKNSDINKNLKQSVKENRVYVLNTSTNIMRQGDNLSYHITKKDTKTNNTSVLHEMLQR